MANNSRDVDRENAELLAIYRQAGSPLGDNPDGFARWLTEHLGMVNQDRRNHAKDTPWRTPMFDPRIKKGT